MLIDYSYYLYTHFIITLNRNQCYSIQTYNFFSKPTLLLKQLNINNNNGSCMMLV